MQVGTIVWHVAAHEIGHAIYGLTADGVKNVIKTSTKTLLEEPRAELTALHTMTLLEPAGLLSKVCCHKTLLPWLLYRGLTPFFCLCMADLEVLAWSRLVAEVHRCLKSFWRHAIRPTSM